MKYFSEREQGDRPKTQDQLSELVWRGLQTEIVARINDGSFGARYPEMCPDGQGRLERMSVHFLMRCGPEFQRCRPSRGYGALMRPRPFMM